LAVAGRASTLRPGKVNSSLRFRPMATQQLPIVLGKACLRLLQWDGTGGRRMTLALTRTFSILAKARHIIIHMLGRSSIFESQQHPVGICLFRIRPFGAAALGAHRTRVVGQVRTRTLSRTSGLEVPVMETMALRIETRAAPSHRQSSRVQMVRMVLHLLPGAGPNSLTMVSTEKRLDELLVSGIGRLTWCQISTNHKALNQIHQTATHQSMAFFILHPVRLIMRVFLCHPTPWIISDRA
jgi:hypothetical protein